MNKKMLLLASLALAAMALAAPVSAEEEGIFWWEDDTEKGEVFIEGPKDVEPQPELTFTFKGGLKVGLCEWNELEPFFGTLFNYEKEGGGVISYGLFKEPCATNIPGCKIEVVPNEYPWELELSEKEEQAFVNISNASFKLIPGMGCGGLPEMTVSGKLTGPFNNGNSEIVYTESGDLVSGGNPVKVDGRMGFGTSMTVK